ncbi:gamma-aminobutyric acid type B receptor subunit 2-like [Mya arenaria]|uniref:gamma-aminobutyric acid type B receptor subunit 2-like n=1 Tax=Mya arenaria TaxID=6604 RepID=UPI0022E43023|nr:gamma-aminobutyric acid type B receptor subunit 2-like [Mya arenaria]
MGRIVIAGLFPLSDRVPEGHIGRGVQPAVELALGMINNETSILPKHHLDIVQSDTQCDMAVATKFFFDLVASNNTVVMVFGDACSAVSGPIAEISKEWNVWLLSYADMDPALSDRKKYHNFYRTVPSDNDFNPARLALLNEFNWTSVGTIFQGVTKGTARYGHAHNNLASLLEKADIEIVKSVAFVNDPEHAIKELKMADVRIIIGNFDEQMARLVFCHAYQNGMYGPKYQWIILSGYRKNWWTFADPAYNMTCSLAELNTTVYGYIATDILPLSSSRRRTESGLTPQKYHKEYNRIRRQAGTPYSKYHGYAFDGVWVIAKAVDAIFRKWGGDGPSGHHLSRDLFRGNRIPSALNDTNFRGVTGTIKFSSGDRVGAVLLEQYQGAGMVKIYEYHRINDVITNKSKDSRPIIWRGGNGPPIDRKQVRVEFQRVPNGVYYSMCTLSGMGVTVAVFFLIVNIIFREHRYIKMSSPNLNNIIIVGCILTYLSVFLLGTDGGVINIKYLRYICTSRAWVLSIGFTLAFGAMFSKTWRVHSIFTNIKLHKKVIKDYKLILVVTVLLFIDAALLVTWQILDPLQTSIKNLTVIKEGDLDVIPVVEYCVSHKMTIWLILIYAYKGMLLVFGCFLAWETRQVSIPALNDSKYIGMSVYNVVIMCICGAAVSFVINDQPTSSFVIMGFFIIFSTTITLCLVFMPKIIEIKCDPTGEERRIRARLQKPKRQSSRDEMTFDLQKKNDDLQADNIRCRNIIAEKLRLLHSLMEQLGGDTREIHYLGQHAAEVREPSLMVHRKVIELRLADSSPSKLSTGSDFDDGSLMSDISYGSTAWTMAQNPVHRHAGRATKSINSIGTDFSGKSGLTKRSSVKTCQTEIEEEGDDDVFGGVYCGPSNNRTSAKLTNTCKKNGSANPITEVHPLMHEFPNKSYMTTENDIYKPVIGNNKIELAMSKRDVRFQVPVNHPQRVPLELVDARGPCPQRHVFACGAEHHHIWLHLY